MLLIIEIAQGMVIIEKQEIEDLEKALKESMALENAKKCLEEINQDVDGYRDYLMNKKSVKLRKDINRFNYKLVYPYRQKDFHQSKKDQGGDMTPGRRWMAPKAGGKKYVTFSESSGSGSEDEVYTHNSVEMGEQSNNVFLESRP
ncbi:hypothetical protein NDU88_001955 [Pleurodeles waltl]|uniref:Uncharacterized protein n=1 Tax=Pleurodeles waltl TaxID=8319 RepID=A0AAV7TLU7_PLEWA|nr:hypothetical protein NDU88_001955 [Pleurodeles waltl]